MKKLFLIAVAAMMMSAVQAQDSTTENLYNAGLLHYEKANYAKAVENFNEAAVQGNLKAMRNLAICYENGQGVEKNLPVALVWYEKAAKGGDEVSLRCVGNIYAYFPKEYGVKKDYAKAFDCYSLAAELGDAEAIYQIGRCYEKKRGVEKDKDKAAYYYRLAKALGFSNQYMEDFMKKYEKK